jgi:hypothetical protein
LAATALVATLVGTGVTGSVAYAAAPHFVLAEFGVDKGWMPSRHPRMLADITGDGRADIVGFGNAGVYTSVATGAGGFAPVQFVLADFGYDQGWRVSNNPPAGDHDPVTPRFVTDITGDGRADLVGFGNAGVYTAVSLGNGFFGPFTFRTGTFFALQANGTGCRQMEAIDVNADRRTDLICIRNHDVEVETATGSGGFSAPYVATTEFQVGGGFGDVVIGVSEVTGDGRPDLLTWDTFTLVGRTARQRPDGTFQPSVINGLSVSIPALIGRVNLDPWADQVMFRNGTDVNFNFFDGTFDPTPTHVLSDFGTDNGWDFTKHPRLTADINGDGLSDIVGFGNAGIYTALSLGNATYGPVRFVVADLGYDQAWRLDKHLRTAADITGDGRADIVGFGNFGVFTAISVGDGTFQ